MLELRIPGFGDCTWQELVLDVNGTLTTDGVLLPGVTERLKSLSQVLTVRLLTSDTRGTAGALADLLHARLARVEPGNEAKQKRLVVERVGADRVIAVGNGNNDALMLAEASLGIAVLGDEGTAVKAILSSDLVVRHINDAFDMLLNPIRLLSSLRK